MRTEISTVLPETNPISVLMLVLNQMILMTKFVAAFGLNNWHSGVNTI